MIISKLLTKNYLSNYNYKYKKLKNVLDYNSEKCILIDSLLIDYGMILDDIELVITKTGSKLSHLTIVANEKEVTILKIKEKDYNGLSQSGEFIVNKEDLSIE